MLDSRFRDTGDSPLVALAYCKLPIRLHGVTESVNHFYRSKFIKWYGFEILKRIGNAVGIQTCETVIEPEIGVRNFSVIKHGGNRHINDRKNAADTILVAQQGLVVDKPSAGAYCRDRANGLHPSGDRLLFPITRPELQPQMDREHPHYHNDKDSKSRTSQFHDPSRFLLEEILA